MVNDLVLFHLIGLYVLFHVNIMLCRSGRPSNTSSWVDQVTWVPGKFLWRVNAHWDFFIAVS